LYRQGHKETPRTPGKDDDFTAEGAEDAETKGEERREKGAGF
jgi:hypothetical protein